MAVILADGQVLLEQRPPKGIWGGLLSLPEMPPDADARDWARASLDLTVAPTGQLPPLTHTFTHFVLEIRAETLNVLPHTPRHRASTHRWQALDALEEAALPSPIRRILDQLPSR